MANWQTQRQSDTHVETPPFVSGNLYVPSPAHLLPCWWINGNKAIQHTLWTDVLQVLSSASRYFKHIYHHTFFGSWNPFHLTVSGYNRESVSYIRCQIILESALHIKACSEAFRSHLMRVPFPVEKWTRSTTVNLASMFNMKRKSVGLYYIHFFIARRIKEWLLQADMIEIEIDEHLRYFIVRKRIMSPSKQAPDRTWPGGNTLPCWYGGCWQ